jgi:ABC-type transport system involved in multi-copper enzyme maturation permease subunit
VVSDPSGPKETLELDRIFDNGMQLAYLVGIILSVVVASGLIGNEYSWNTIRPLVARARSRNALLSAKWITVTLYSIGLFLVGLLSCIGFSAVTSALVGNFDGVSAGLVADWVAGFGRLLVASLPYAALAFCLSLLFRSNAVGIAVAIGIGLLEPALWSLLGLLTDAFEPVRKLGMDYPATLLSNMSTTFEDPVSMAEAWRAVATLTGWTAIFVGLTYYFFNKRDVTG